MGRPVGSKNKVQGKPRQTKVAVPDKPVDVYAEVKAKFAQWDTLSPADREQLKAVTAKMLEQEEAKLAALEQIDPFWSFHPSDGKITAEGMEILQKYLKPDDIPPSGMIDGQKDAFLSDAPITGVSGGNQGGKSLWQIIRRIIKGTGALPAPMRSWYPKEMLPNEKDFPLYFRYVGVDHTTFLNTTLPAWQKWVPKEFLIDGSWDKSYREEGKDGQRVLKLGKKGKLYCAIEFFTNEMKVGKFQGPPRQGVDYDEEPRYDIYKENLYRFTTAKELDITFAFTPTNGLSWATELFEDGVDKTGNRVNLYKISSITNPKANLATVRDILDLETDYEALKMRLLGEFISLSGLVYGKLFSPKIHVIEPFVLNRRDFVVHLGMDPHLVTPTAAVFLALDRENNKYVVDCYNDAADTDVVKAEICRRFMENDWRWGFSVADRSSDTSIMAFGGKNIFKELRKQPNAIRALRTSEKYEGSIKAGVDEIKRSLKIKEQTGTPSLFIFNTDANRQLIQAFRTMERDTYANEDDKGPKDRIKEGRFHLHAALRYLFQYPLAWYPEVFDMPRYEMYDEAACY